MKQLRFRLEAIALRLAVAIVPRLPRRFMLFLAQSLGGLAYRIDKRGRRVADTNLATVFPDWTSSTRQQVIHEAYRYQVVSAFDLLWAPRNLSAKTAQRYVHHEYDDEADFLSVAETATIWITPHYGTFEWLPIEWALTRTKPTIVAEDFKNPALTPIIKSLREYSGITVISQDRAMVRLLKHVKRGGQTAFLTDLRVPPSRAATIIECFGLKTCVTIMHAFLAKQTGAPILPVICLPQTDGTYVFKFHRSFRPGPDDSPQQIAQQCWNVFENEIRKDPAPWMWMYKHWRYLPMGTDPSTYPSYASHSKAFGALEESFGSA